MNNIFRTLHSIKDDNNLAARQKYIIQSTVEHLEHLQKQCCENCVYYIERNRDGTHWYDCEHNFDCTVVRNNNFKAKDIQ